MRLFRVLSLRRGISARDNCQVALNGATSRVIRFIALAENTIALNRVCLTFRALKNLKFAEDH